MNLMHFNEIKLYVLGRLFFRKEGMGKYKEGLFPVFRCLSVVK